MDVLAEDLALLSLKPKTGHVTNLRFSLMGSELVCLAASQRIDIAGDRIVVLDPSPTGDPELDAALASIAGSRRPPQPKSWVGGPRKRIVENYLARLVAAGTVRAEQRKVLGIVSLTHWEVVETPRLAAARGRLDAVAHSSGPVDAEQAALGGLAHAAGIGDLVYPGKENKRLRKRLEEVVKSQRDRPDQSGDPGGDVEVGACAGGPRSGASRSLSGASQGGTCRGRCPRHGRPPMWPGSALFCWRHTRTVMFTCSSAASSRRSPIRGGFLLVRSNGLGDRAHG